MPTNLIPSSQRVLEPNDRISEVLFGLIMVLAFTGSLSVAEAGRDDISAMLVGALGCNLAWGIIDAILYLMGCLADKGRGLKALKAIRGAPNPELAQQVIADALPPLVASVMQLSELDAIRQRLLRLPEPRGRAHLSGRDWRGGVGVFLIVFLSTFPVALPFVFMRDTMLAMRVSNAIAVTMLFFAGAGYGRIVGRSPLVFGLGMVVLGGGLVALTIALGG
jgi:VIT family